MGDVAEREATDDRAGHRHGHAVLDLAARRAGVVLRHRGGADPRATASGGSGWDPALVEPSLRGAVVLDATPIAAPRGDLVGAGGARLVTPRPVVRFGIDRIAGRRGARRRLRPPAGPAARRRPGGVREAGRGRRGQGVRRGARAAPTEVPCRRVAASATGGSRAPGRSQDDAPLGRHRRLRRADPGPRRRGDRGDDRRRPRALPARATSPGCPGSRRGTTTSSPAAPAWSSDAVAADGKERELFRVDAHPGDPARAHPGPGAAAGGRAHAGAGGAGRRRWSRSAPPPERCWSRPTGPAPAASTSRPTARRHRARRSRPSAASPCCAPG